MLESAGFEMMQMVWYRGSGVAVKEQGEKGHSAQHIVEGCYEEYWRRGRLIELGCSMIHGPLAGSCNSLPPECATKHQFHLKVVRGYGISQDIPGYPGISRDIARVPNSRCDGLGSSVSIIMAAISKLPTTYGR